jgi:amino acid adenylation domain-containing protein
VVACLHKISLHSDSFKDSPQNQFMSALSERVAGLSPEKQRLLALLLKEKNIGLSRLPLLAQSRETNVFPLSFAQQRLWFLDQLDPGSPTYLIPATFRFTGPLDIESLKRSLDEVVRRHEVLRTSFATVEGRPVQVIARPLALDVPVIDLSGLSEQERRAEVRRMTDEEGAKPFNLERGPLLRATLLRLSEQEHVALFTMHHISSDGWSMDVLNREVATIYEAYKQGKPSPLPELTLQYADFAVWQREWLRGEVLEKQLEYWKKQLAGAPPLLDLPTDRPRPAAQTYRGAVYPFHISSPVAKALRDLCQQEGVTLFMTLLAAFKVLLSRYSGQSDIVVGTPIAGRTRGETEDLIGFFVNALVLRTDLPGELNFRQLLKRVKDVALGAYAHQDLPFEKLVEELQRERHLSYSPLFQVLFSFQNAPQELRELTGVKADSSGGTSVASKFDLTLDMSEIGERVIAGLEYSTDLFDEETIKRMAGHYLRILDAVALDAGQRIYQLPLLTESERHQQLIEWNDTAVDYLRHLTLHQLFEAQAAATPDAVALRYQDEQLTYAQLNERANHLANYLRQLGVGPESLVGVCFERSPEMVLSLLAVLKAGGAYVPLDPHYPVERLAFMIRDANITLLLTHSLVSDTGLSVLADHQTQVVEIDSQWEMISLCSGENPAVLSAPDNLAYVIYTSGSTGQPKGVAITHKSATALLAWAESAFTASEVSTVLASTSICFDLSIFELFVPLSRGATVVLAQTALDLASLAEMGITLVNTVPSAITELVRMQAVPESVRVVNLAGEALSRALVDEIYGACRAVEQVNNLYGPSEDTTYSTWAQMERRGAGAVMIGRPVSNTQAYVLDRQMQMVAVGVSGELYLGGEGLARGYWRRPEQTAERFVPNPFGLVGGERLYRTGDIVRYRADGNLEFIGRGDEQVKVRGFRIELGEIESVLGAHESVREVVVIAREDTPGDKRLVAYIIGQETAQSTDAAGTQVEAIEAEAIEVNQLRAYLKERLPYYMVPSAFVTLEEMPLTPNGKVNRKALPAPGSEGLAENEYVAPRDTLEMELTKIWQGILGLKNISIKDDFFELGGHSLLAVRLFAQIGKVIDIELPLSTLFQASTIEQLAAVLRMKSGALRVSPSSLVELHGEGTLRPFFCVHPGGGNIFCYMELARQLGKDQPVYAFQSREVEKGAAWPSIEQMAKHYVELLRGVQAEGPYNLGGLSLGGVVAFEMSRQLEDAGQKVSFLAVLDVPAPGAMEIFDDDDLMLMLDFAEGMGLSPESISLPREQALKMSVPERLAYVIKQGQQEGVVPMEITFATVEWLWKVFQENVRAVMVYRGGSYGGKLTLFRTAATCAYFSEDHTMGWGELADGGVQVEDVPGTHNTMVRTPHVETLASRLSAHLREA